MAHTKQHSGPVPPGNQPRVGPADASGQPSEGGQQQGEVASFQEQDPKRRIGDFEGAGQHPRQQPSPANDGTQHSR